MAVCEQGQEEGPQVELGAKDLVGANRVLALLSPSSRDLVLTMLGQLAEREGITMEMKNTAVGTPAAGMALWQAKLKQEAYSPRTIETYRSTLMRFLAEYPTPTRLDIQSWLAKQMECCSTSTVSTHKKALRSLFSFLHEEGLWPTDPTLRLRSVKVTYTAKDPPTLEEVLQLLTYKCRRSKDTRRFVMMTLLLSTTALRITEAASLQRNRVYFDRHEIRVMGKGGKERVVPLVQAAEDALKVYMEDTANGSPFVFSGETKTGYWTISGYEKTLKRACVKLGMKPYTPHYLRHFYATYLLRKGAKLEVVSRILGHASIGITGDLYRHVQTEEIHDTSRQFAPLQAVPQLGQGETVEGQFTEVDDDGR